MWGGLRVRDLKPGQFSKKKDKVSEWDNYRDGRYDWISDK